MPHLIFLDLCFLRQLCPRVAGHPGTQHTCKLDLGSSVVEEGLGVKQRALGSVPARAQQPGAALGCRFPCLGFSERGFLVETGRKPREQVGWGKTQVRRGVLKPGLSLEGQQSHRLPCLLDGDWALRQCPPVIR